MTTLNEQLVLRSGQVLGNRIVKAATEEFLAGAAQAPTTRLLELYRRWGAGGAGLLLTGHVMVDRRALADPSDVVLDEQVDLEPFRDWARAAHSGGARIWMQINHPGRVVTADMPGTAWSASDVAVDIGSYSRLYAQPVALDEQGIRRVIERFATTAALAASAGFDGVEIHAAHGYLIAQFLSPRTNLRDDDWGGDLTGRARLLLAVVEAVRARVPAGFAIGVKLNTADFQRGGFDVDDAARVVDLLALAGVDLVELSGGSIESLATHGRTADERTLAREAYFLESARDILDRTTLPVMVTGGIRRRGVAVQVLDAGASLVGVATAMAVDPDLATRWLAGHEGAVAPIVVRWPDKMLASAALQAVARCRMRALGAGTRRRARPFPALLDERLRRTRALRRYRRWLGPDALIG